MYHRDTQFIAIFGGFGESKALRDYHLLDVDEGTITKQNKFSDVGVEMSFKRVQKLVNGEFIFSSDANSEIYRVTDENRHIYNDFVFDFAQDAEYVDYDVDEIEN